MKISLTILILLIVIVTVLIVLCAEVYYRKESCGKTMDVWCYSDWKCNDVPSSDPRSNPVKYTMDTAVKCIPDEDGYPPATCPNTWSDVLSANPTLY